MQPFVNTSEEEEEEEEDGVPSKFETEKLLFQSLPSLSIPRNVLLLFFSEIGFESKTSFPSQ